MNVLNLNHGAIVWWPDVGGGPPESHDENHRNYRVFPTTYDSWESSLGFMGGGW